MKAKGPYIKIYKEISSLVRTFRGEINVQPNLMEGGGGERKGRWAINGQDPLVGEAAAAAALGRAGC